MTIQSLTRDAGRYVYAMPKGRVGNRMQAAALASEERRVEKTWRQARRIILVHTMGKVGSMAISHALRQHCDPDVAIFHTHRLIGIDDPVALAERANLAPRKTWFTSSAILGLLKTSPKPVSVVTVVRDPLERNVSGFFQTLERYTDNGRPLRPGASLPPADELARLFVDRYPHLAVTTWLDREVTSHFGVDVYSTPFDPKHGWTELSSGDTQLVLARFDRLGNVAPEMLSSVSDRPIDALPPRNTSEDKHIGSIARQVRGLVMLPHDIERALYESHYATHFGFSPAAIGEHTR